MKKNDLTTEIPVKDRHGNVVGQKTVVRFSGLLAKAHEEGLKRITTKLVQAPTKENGSLAVVHAVVETKQGSYEGLGDATLPGNWPLIDGLRRMRRL